MKTSSSSPFYPWFRSRARFAVTSALALSLLLPVLPVRAAEDDDDPPDLEVLARYAVPEDYSRITGVQWAGKRSVYLGVFDRGVIEVELGDGLRELDRLFSTEGDPPTSGLHAVVRFGVSDRWVVVDHNRLAWARRNSGGGPVVPRLQRTLAGALDFDLDGDRIVLWGRPGKPQWEEAKAGVLWEAHASKGLESWRVLYEVEEVEATPGLLGDTLVTRGSVELLENGDIILAPNLPGVLPAVLRFASSGKLQETWAAEDLWERRGGEPVDAGGDEPWLEGPMSGKAFSRILGKRRTVDAVLGLPQGPALVVREPGDGGVRWRLAVLSPEVRWYDLPVHDISSVAQLRADADDDGRIVLVGTTRELFDEARVRRNEILVVRLPFE